VAPSHASTVHAVTDNDRQCGRVARWDANTAARRERRLTSLTAQRYNMCQRRTTLSIGQTAGCVAAAGAGAGGILPPIMLLTYVLCPQLIMAVCWSISTINKISKDIWVINEFLTMTHLRSKLVSFNASVCGKDGYNTFKQCIYVLVCVNFLVKPGRVTGHAYSRTERII